jgi:hypothetical protein
MSKRTHTHLFESDSTTEPIDLQINEYSYENSCKPIQVSMVNYTMSSTLTVLVIFETGYGSGDGFD